MTAVAKIAAYRQDRSTVERSASGYRHLFRLVVWLGILVNLSFAVPAVLSPSWLLRRTGLPMPNQSIWLRDSGMLLLFLSAMYVPAARDPQRYAVNAAVAVVARLVFAVFWLSAVFGARAPRGHLSFGLVDLFFGLAQGSLLLRLLREGHPTGDAESE
jgi:hypothetical protein